MSKKKRKQQPAPAPEPVTGGAISGYYFTLNRGTITVTSTARLGTTEEAGDLTEVVGKQVAALTEGFDGATVPELPEPPRDLTTYRDAYASAAKNCKHPDAVEMLYGREWVCDLCGRTLNRDDMRRAGKAQWWWS